MPGQGFAQGNGGFQQDGYGQPVRPPPYPSRAAGGRHPPGRPLGPARGSGHGSYRSTQRYQSKQSEEVPQPRQYDVTTGVGDDLQHAFPVEGAALKAKKPRPPHFFRCKMNGHLSEVCKVKLDCYICNKKNNHLPIRCPILKLPKPSTHMYGYAKNGLCFYGMPDFDLKQDDQVLSPTALVTISGGSLPAGVVQDELARLSRSDWNWEALPHEDDSFLVVFPFEDELQRMSDVEFKLKNHGVTLLVSAWQTNGDVVPAYQLDEVWVHVSRVPHTWRHYLGFWALGTAIGKTIEVDMFTYRKLGVIRIKVGMMDRALLPVKPDTVFGLFGYDITFTLESDKFIPAVPVQGMEDSMNHDGDGAGDNSADGQGGNLMSKKQKQANDSGSSSSNTAVVDGGPTPMQLSAGVPVSTPVRLVEGVPVSTPVRSVEKVSAATEEALYANSFGCLAELQSEIGEDPPSPASVLIGEIPVSVLGDSNNKTVSDVALLKSNVDNQGKVVECEGKFADRQQEGVQHADMCVAGAMLMPRVSAFDEGVNDIAAPDILTQEGGNSADEHMMAKAMKRTALQNLDSPRDNKTVASHSGMPHSSSATQLQMTGYLCSFSPSPFVGYPAKTGITGYGCGGIATVGAVGEGFLYPGIWVAI